MGIEFCALVFLCALVAGCAQNSNDPAPNAPAPPAATATVSTPTAPPSYDFSSLDNLLERIARKHGGSALVVVEDQTVVYRKGFGGHAPDSVIPIASASKWLSGALIFEMHKDQTGGARIAYTIYERHAALDDSLLPARYGSGMWREKVDDRGQLVEASSQGALGFSPWIDAERNLAGVLSLRSSFSLALPDYLAVKDQIRRIVPRQNEPLQTSTARFR